ncbi:MAG: F0F1 ATP synthase subunit A [Leptospirales bacterium]
MLSFLTQLVTPSSGTGENTVPVLEEASAHAIESFPEPAGFDMSGTISHHLSDSTIWELDWEVFGHDISITKRVMMMWIASFFLFAIFIPAARKIAKNIYGKPSRFTGIVEVFVNFIRIDVARGSMGKLSKPYEPFLLTLFFFVLFCNLLGLIPPLGEIAYKVSELFGSTHAAGGHGDEVPFLVKLWPGTTPTGDIAVTATLAIMSFMFILAAGFIHQGIAFIKNIVPKGVPFPINIILWFIEIIGLLSKPFALAIRLLANMTAGHLIILVFLGFIFQFQSWGVVPASIGASVAIYLLEIFVGFLQAYIFVFLTALFIASVQHRH